MTTRDGYYYNNKSSTLHSNLKCKGAIHPQTNTSSRSDFDVIIIGAGYAGLTATRDLCVSGHDVLLLEARDRIGGRTFTTEVDDHLYEMGGTWVHWNQPHTYREMSRYGLTDVLESHEDAPGFQYCTVKVDGKVENLSKEVVHEMTEKAFRTLCDVDGKLGRSIIPYPHNPHHNPSAKHWGSVPLSQRLSDICTSLTTRELSILKARLSSITGGDFEKASFFDVLRWWALGGYTMDGLYETGDDYKLRKGQSHFARCFFDEALQTGRLSYEFGGVVERVVDEGEEGVAVDGKWRAKRVICTVPLNVLRDVHFEPPLKEEKTRAAELGNVNHGAKVHLEVSGTKHRAWSSAVYPVNRVCSASGDGFTPEGNTHLVCFGANGEFEKPDDDARSFGEDVRKCHEMDILKTIWHNWSGDPFAKGSWCMYPPEFSFKYLWSLQERAGNVLFASSDWASGWRGFIDGAIEQGMLVARDVATDLRGQGKDA